MKMKLILAAMALGLGSVAALAQSLAVYQGMHPIDIFRDPAMAEQLNIQLGPSYAQALERVEVAPPAEIAGDYIYGTGCKSHNCSVDEIFYAISPERTFAAILVGGQLRRMIGRVEELPPTIQAAYQAWFGRIPTSP